MGRKVRIVNPACGDIQHVIDYNGSNLRLAWCPTQEWLAALDLCAREQQRLQIFDADAGLVMRVCTGADSVHDQVVGCSGDVIAWSPSGQYIATVWCPN